ncbi:MAG: glutathione synthetase [Pseudomonadota bacterium]|nr:glutathione synthetase [Pseudomonadota bacterium]
MLIAFFVNDMAKEFPNYTTTVLAHQAVQRGHRVCYITPGDFVMLPDDSMQIHARMAPDKKSKTHAEFFKGVQTVGEKTEQIAMSDVDVLWLRSDPSLDAQTASWAAEAGILFGREAVKRGVLVLNDPNSLSLAVNKMYFQSFPEAARAETLITKHAPDVKAFAKKHGGECILKPLQGSGGSGVFKLDADNASNLNQMIEAITRDGYVIAQAYVPAAAKGDIRLFMMNGRPLSIGKKYAALRRVSAKDDIRSNIHAGGKAVAVEVGETELRVAELIRPKLIADGMFLVGIDIVGDKILEVNVFSPGNLQSCSKIAGVNFAEPIIASIERKVEISKEFANAFDNRALAVM